MKRTIKAIEPAALLTAEADCVGSVVCLFETAKRTDDKNPFDQLPWKLVRAVPLDADGYVVFRKDAKDLGSDRHSGDLGWWVNGYEDDKDEWQAPPANLVRAVTVWDWSSGVELWHVTSLPHPVLQTDIEYVKLDCVRGSYTLQLQTVAAVKTLFGR